MEKQIETFIKKFMASETEDGKLKTFGTATQEEISFIKENKEIILRAIRTNKKEKNERELQNKKEFAIHNSRMHRLENNFMGI